MKRFVSFALIILCICCSFCGCHTQNIKEQDNEDYEIMLAKHINYGMYDISEDFWSSTEFTLNTNHTLTKTIYYNISDDIEQKITLDDKDFQEILSLLDRIKSTNGDIPDDGSIWIIAKYNKEEKELIKFEAEIDSNKHAKRLIERLNELFPEND